MYSYPREEIQVSDSLIQYLIEDRVWVVPEGKSEGVITDRKRFYSATFNTETKFVYCDYRKFETSGIICRHIIRILEHNQVVDIPQQYILNRWRKDILRKHTCVKVSYYDPNKTLVGKRYNTLMNAFEPICEEAAMVNDEAVAMVLESLEKLKSEVGQCNKRKLEQTVPLMYPEENVPPCQPTSDDFGTTTTLPQPIDMGVKDPLPKKRGRRRPKGSRNKGLAEIGYKKPRQKKVVQVRRNFPPQQTVAEANQMEFVAEDDILLTGTSTSFSEYL
ncbi:protein FAR1-RELATED SEQUENCE 6-like [Chenopodium quinoa]|uniref:protein FAR1-RELATED SEQUENCE 6-like n=1 Tax=Chenopodium quinoa TaxID=63459 RepID=UPI000B776885|nr:protein FAR1-RELATED SEQUENCE 6-like [Chenopodium quinoa]